MPTIILIESVRLYWTKGQQYMTIEKYEESWESFPIIQDIVFHEFLLVLLNEGNFTRTLDTSWYNGRRLTTREQNKICEYVCCLVV